MLSLANLVFLGVMTLSNIILHFDGDYPAIQNMTTVTEISAHREWWRDDAKCHFTGVMVAFDRDWEEVTETEFTKTVLPAEPGKAAGQALLFNRKVCGDKVERINRFSTIYATTGTAYRNSTVKAYDLTGAKPETDPKWLARVNARLVQLAETDNVAKAFVTFNSANPVPITEATAQEVSPAAEAHAAQATETPMATPVTTTEEPVHQ